MSGLADDDDADMASPSAAPTEHEEARSAEAAPAAAIEDGAAPVADGGAVDAEAADAGPSAERGAGDAAGTGLHRAKVLGLGLFHCVSLISATPFRTMSQRNEALP